MNIHDYYYLILKKVINNQVNGMNLCNLLDFMNVHNYYYLILKKVINNQVNRMNLHNLLYVISTFVC